MVLFGHPTGNPNSHQAALAHYEHGQLEAFCVPWFPSEAELGVLSLFPTSKAEVARLKRRRFEPLAKAPKIQGRVGEWRRMAVRLAGRSDQRLSYEANDWLMRTMARECRRKSVSAVHSYEDCSLWQFEEARRHGKTCIYDMPTCYYPWWQEKENELLAKYARWLPESGVEAHRWVRPDQKVREMELADVVLAPSSFVKRTILERCDKEVRVCVYGADTPSFGDYLASSPTPVDTVRFLHIGQCSVRKGTPFLLELWRRLGLRHAELVIAGTWNLSASLLKELPRGVSYVGVLDPLSLRELYASGHVLLFPSFADGFGLVMIEAMAAGMSVIGSVTSGAPDIASSCCVATVDAGDEDAWAAAIEDSVHSIRTSGHIRDAALECARAMNWDGYREAVGEVMADLV